MGRLAKSAWSAPWNAWAARGVPAPCGGRGVMSKTCLHGRRVGAIHKRELSGAPQGGGEQVAAAARLNVGSVIAFAAGVLLGFGALATLALQHGLEGAQAQQSADAWTALKASF